MIPSVFAQHIWQPCVSVAKSETISNSMLAMIQKNNFSMENYRSSYIHRWRCEEKRYESVSFGMKSSLKVSFLYQLFPSLGGVTGGNHLQLTAQYCSVFFRFMKLTMKIELRLVMDFSFLIEKYLDDILDFHWIY